MPLYEYQCESCGTRFERIQKFSDPPVESCPSCAGAVKKLLSSPAIQFKGSGWYITDYAKKPTDTTKTTKTPGDSTPSTTTSDTSDSKTTSSASDATSKKD